MKTVTRNLPVIDFTEPPGIVWASVDPSTGEAVPDWSGRGTYREVFNENNVPKSPMYRIWRWFFHGKKAEDPDKSPETGVPENEQFQSDDTDETVSEQF